MTRTSERLLIFCAGAGLTAGVLTVSSERQRREKRVDQGGTQITLLQQALDSARTSESAARENTRQVQSSNAALKASLRESTEEIARLNSIVAQRKLMPITVVRLKNPDGRWEFQLRNAGAEPLEIYVSVANPERKRTDLEYPKSRSSFQTLPAKQVLTFASYSNDMLSVVCRGFADFREFYP